VVMVGGSLMLQWYIITPRVFKPSGVVVSGGRRCRSVVVVSGGRRCRSVVVVSGVRLSRLGPAGAFIYLSVVGVDGK